MRRQRLGTKYTRLRLGLIDARRQSGLTQAELAGRLHRPQSFVSKYERNERRLDVVEFLEVAAAIGIDPLALLKDLVDEPQAEIDDEGLRERRVT